MDELKARDVVFENLKSISDKIDSRLPNIIDNFREARFTYMPDLENDLVDEIYRVAQQCNVKWYDGAFYVFDGKIYVAVSNDAIEGAFKVWMSRIGLKISQKRKQQIFKNEFLPMIKLSNKLTPRLDIVAFSNGILDLSDTSFHDFSPEYHVMYYHPYKYDKKAKCNLWQKFLKEVLPDKRSRIILQMFLGLGLIERGTVYNQCEGKEHPKIELCLILIGEGANGKSVIYQTAMGIFGRDRISGIDYDELTSQGDEGMRARRLLREAIFNWSSDSDSRTFGRKRTGVFKRIVSGEPVTDRSIGNNVTQNFNLPYLIFNLNELPYPDDNSLGFIRRLQFISFDVTIPKANQNKTLAQDLTAEYSGIFNWILRGTKEIRKRKFQFPDAEGSRRQLLLAQLRGNPVVAWINAYHIRSIPQAPNEQCIWVSAKEVVQCVEEFCRDNDVECPTKQKIGHTLTDHYFDKKRTSDGYEYKMYGVSLGQLLDPFVIRNESFAIEGEDEDGFIDAND